MKKRNERNAYVVDCPPCGESTLKGGKGVVTEETSIDNPPSALRATSPAGGEENGGFTLIELLVVVLIIGILAAVAVSQYQKAVQKAKTEPALAVFNSAIKQMHLYALGNGNYPIDLDALDIPGSKTGKNPYYGCRDWRSMGEWSIGLQNNNYGVMLTLMRVNGPYEGTGFFYLFTHGSWTTNKLICLEQKKKLHSMNKYSGVEGSYCVNIMKATQAYNCGGGAEFNCWFMDR